jgi:hypothetical protein
MRFSTLHSACSPPLLRLSSWLFSARSAAFLCPSVLEGSPFTANPELPLSGELQADAPLPALHPEDL